MKEDLPLLNCFSFLLGELVYKYTIGIDRNLIYQFGPKILDEKSPYFPEGATLAFAVPVDPEGTYEWRTDMDDATKSLIRTTEKAVKHKALRQRLPDKEGLDPLILETFLPEGTVIDCDFATEKEKEYFPRLIVWTDKNGMVYVRFMYFINSKKWCYDTLGVNPVLFIASCYVNMILSRMDWDFFAAQNIWNIKTPEIHPNSELDSFRTMGVKTGDMIKKTFPFWSSVELLSNQEKTWQAVFLEVPQELYGMLPFLSFSEKKFAAALACVLKVLRVYPILQKDQQGLADWAENSDKVIPEAMAMELLSRGNKQILASHKQIFQFCAARGVDSYDENMPVFHIVCSLCKLDSLEPAPSDVNFDQETLSSSGIPPVADRDVGTICLPSIRMTIGILGMLPYQKPGGNFVIPFLPENFPVTRGVEAVLLYRKHLDILEASFDIERDAARLIADFFSQSPRNNNFEEILKH